MCPATPALLESLTGTVTRDAAFANADVWLSTHFANPGSSGADELTFGTGAAGRQLVPFNNGGTGADPSQLQTVITVPSAQTVTWYGLWTAQTGGTFLQGIPAIQGPMLMAAGQNGQTPLLVPGHGLIVNDVVRLFVAPNAQSGIPVGFSGDPSTYFVKTVFDPDTFTLAATLGGTAITPSSSAGFLMAQDDTQVFTGAGMLVINAGNILYETVSQ